MQSGEMWRSREAQRRVGILLYKPRGVLSATKDAHLPTVIDLVDDPDRDALHLVGRLDRWTSGLVLLTNDGNWSKALMHPDRKVPKVYEVETEELIAEGAEEAFARGFYFHTEDITTLPVTLERLEDRKARLTLHEGRYHQIKRMFHRVGNRVKSLHRTAIGGLELPHDWQPGQWRCLTGAEMDSEV
jgi:16S rRNA pseudouridine516 synthase